MTDDPVYSPTIVQTLAKPPPLRDLLVADAEVAGIVAALAVLAAGGEFATAGIILSLTTVGVKFASVEKQKDDPTATILSDLSEMLNKAADKVLNPPQLWELGMISDRLAGDIKTWSKDCGCPCTQSSGSAAESSAFSIAALSLRNSRLARQPTNVRIENFTASKAIVSSRARLDGRSDVTVRIGGIPSVGQGGGNARSIRAG
jgi:hypothetical protein